MCNIYTYPAAHSQDATITATANPLSLLSSRYTVYVPCFMGGGDILDRTWQKVDVENICFFVGEST